MADRIASLHCTPFEIWFKSSPFHPYKPMKIPTLFRPRQGFTLIELLVVVAIILVLAAASFAVATGVLNRARKLNALNTATAIDQAVNAFYSEYGGFPTENETRELDTTSPDGVVFLNILIGHDDETSRRFNPRGMSFLAVKEGKGDADSGSNGIIYGSDGAALAIYDPWGNPYYVVMDIEFNDYLEFTPEGIDDATKVRLNRRRVAVYSPGVPEGDEATKNTMVKSW